MRSLSFSDQVADLARVVAAQSAERTAAEEDRQRAAALARKHGAAARPVPIARRGRLTTYARVLIILGDGKAKRFSDLLETGRVNSKSALQSTLTKLLRAGRIERTGAARKYLYRLA